MKTDNDREAFRINFSIILQIIFVGACSTVSLLEMGCSHSPIVESEKQKVLRMEKQVFAANPNPSISYAFLKKEEEDLLAPGDLLSFTYPADTKMNGRFRISFEGVLQLPYNVKVKLNGVKLGEAIKLIRGKYTDIFKNYQEIQITLVERKRWLQITGDISVTGLKLVEPTADLTEILSLKSTNGAISNSTEERKKLKYVKIKWNQANGLIDLKKYFKNEISWEERKWHGGEILSFQSNLTSDEDDTSMIRVLGEVNEPGSYEYSEKSDYFSYILKAGGATSAADIDRIYIIRGPAFNREVFQVGIDDLNKIAPPSPNDTLLLMRDRTSLTERKVGMAASLASILSTLLLLKVLF